jgi:hypothetical protein
MIELQVSYVVLAMFIAPYIEAICAEIFMAPTL